MTGLSTGTAQNHFLRPASHFHRCDPVRFVGALVVRNLGEGNFRSCVFKLHGALANQLATFVENDMRRASFTEECYFVGTWLQLCTIGECDREREANGSRLFLGLRQRNSRSQQGNNAKDEDQLVLTFHR